MNLGISVDTGAASNIANETAATAPQQSAAAAPAGMVFGQWMAKALQQQEKKTGTPDEAGTGIGSSDLIGALGSPEQGAQEDGTPTLTKTTQGTEDPALLQTNWLLAWQGMPPIRHISVGPGLQAITADDAAPDDSSLADFARKQGLDAQAIAWLMGAGSPGLAGSRLAAQTALTPSIAAGHLAGVDWAGQSASSLGPSVPTPSESKGGVPAALAALTAAASLTPGNANTAAITASGMAATATAPAPSPPQAAASPGGLSLLAANTEWRLSGDAGVSGDLTTQGGTATATGHETELEGMDPGNALLAQLRWAQMQRQAQVAASKGAQSSAEAGQPNAAATVDTLDLQALLDTDLPQAASPSSGISPAGAQDGANASPTQPTLSAPARALATAAHIARDGASVHTGNNPTQASEQMQQLSEKMADAIGQRMLREIEKGQWNLRLMLKPAQMGHIEIEMRLHAGELNATFAAPHAATRELLADGLSRLRDSLNQAGMDVANLDVRNGQNRQNGGDSTQGQRQFASNAKSTDMPESAAPTVESKPRPRRSDGWDVMV